MVTIEEFTQMFLDQFDELPSVTLTPDTRFRELPEWSSLVALSVLSMIDDELEVDITAAEMRSANTIQELYDKLYQNHE